MVEMTVVIFGRDCFCDVELAGEEAIEIAGRHGAVSGNFRHCGFRIAEMRKSLLRGLDDLGADASFSTM